jgi:hypothetical protein
MTVVKEEVEGGTANKPFLTSGDEIFGEIVQCASFPRAVF